MLILSIQLEGLHSIGDPAFVTYSYLAPSYWPEQIEGNQSLLHKTLIYNFESVSGMDAYEQQVASLLQSIQE